jgi:cysteine desulfurase
LYVRRGVQLMSQVNGGGQERRRRAGTENVPGIVGFATALRQAEEHRAEYVAHSTALREQFIAGIAERVGDVQLNGHATERLPNNVNVSIAGTEAESLLMLLDQQGICASSGSACTSGSLEPSHVLRALGLDDDAAHASLRLTVGKDTTTDDVNFVLDALPPMVEKLRSVSLQWRER